MTESETGGDPACWAHRFEDEADDDVMDAPDTVGPTEPVGHRREPWLIQGGMGIAVSDWRLARAVARTGQMGVVSGTALDTVLARRLQLGDPDGDLRRGLDALPLPGAAERILERYFVAGGKDPDAPFVKTPMNARRAVAASCRAPRCRELRGGVPGQGGARRACRHQLPREGAGTDAGFALRRDVGGCRLCVDGCGYPEVDSERARASVGRPSRRSQTRRQGSNRRGRFPGPTRSGGVLPA